MPDNIDNNKTPQYDRIESINLERSMRQYYIDYAMSVITSRALPDVRDGLKPVQRRIMYAMSELNLTPDKPYRKSARIVGDTMGKYHPHGDTSIYDAMVHMAQDFNMRYMLVDGHGNFGSVDGDEQAAMRYTEARMSRIALEMLADLNKNTVDFVPNFDGSLKEPTVLPSHFPNLLVNGTGGIAVGMATNIPPHNLGEVIDGVVKIIDNHVLEGRNTEIEEILKIIKGPDFPTGATIYGVSGIEQAYRTGRGRIVVRANMEVEEMAGGRQRIAVSEIPFQVNKARLIERIAELVKDKKLEGISDLRDESDRTGMRIAIELKRDANAKVIMNQLYKNTQLQDAFSCNMLALVHGEPKILNILQMLTYYLDHQKDVVTRRTQYDLERAQARAHILEGLLKALDYIDEIISIIRGSQTVAMAKERLMQRFEFSEAQAQAIVDMRLRALTGLERDRLQGEYDELESKISEYMAILSNENILYSVIKEELLIIKTKYADPRRTAITYEEGEIDLVDLIKDEPCVITMSKLGYIKRTSLDMYRSQNRGGKGIKGMETREGDYVKKMFVATAHDFLTFFTNRGKVYQMRAYEIPEAGRTARGTAIVNLLSLPGEERVREIVMRPADAEYPETACLIFATRMGQIKKTYLSEYANIRSNGLIAINLQENDELIGVGSTNGSTETPDDIMLATRDGQMIRFCETDVRPTGRSTSGVRGITVTEGDAVIDMQIIPQGENDPDLSILAVTENGMGKRTALEEFSRQYRGGKGVLYYRITEKTGRVVSTMAAGEEQELMLLNSEGVVIRMKVADISRIGRVTSGVKLISLEEETRVVAAALIQERLLDISSDVDPDEDDDLDDGLPEDPEDLEDLDFE